MLCVKHLLERPYNNVRVKHEIRMSYLPRYCSEAQYVTISFLCFLGGLFLVAVLRCRHKLRGGYVWRYPQKLTSLLG